MTPSHNVPQRHKGSARCPECGEIGTHTERRETEVLGELSVWECEDCDIEWRLE